MDVIRLLKSKNRCLERFLDISNTFLVVVESGDFSGLEAFHKQRERILKGFDLYDRKLTECIENLPDSDLGTEVSRQAEQALNMKDALIRKIAEIDHKIVEKIEIEKSRIMKELASSQKNSTLVKKFKSSWVSESGEELDKKL